MSRLYGWHRNWCTDGDAPRILNGIRFSTENGRELSFLKLARLTVARELETPPSVRLREAGIDLGIDEGYLTTDLTIEGTSLSTGVAVEPGTMQDGLLFIAALGLRGGTATFALKKRSEMPDELAFAECSVYSSVGVSSRAISFVGPEGTETGYDIGDGSQLIRDLLKVGGSSTS